MTFLAQYYGSCPACGEEIRRGQRVKYDEGDLVHSECSDTALPSRPLETCNTCWLIKPCECDQ